MLSFLTLKIGADIAGLQKDLQKATGHLGGFGKQINTIGRSIASAFAIQQVASFALEVSRLAGEAEAVRAAFERLPNSTKLMRDLRDATGGTVSELDLMKRAVQASNFDISLAALPKLLQFATLRAQQTGQSVDYLVDSIVTGIGRKSKLILDNLGISAVQLNEALGDTAIGAASIGQVADAVGKIIDKNLDSMNGFMDTNSTKLQKLAASWTNLKVAIGDAANGTGVLGSSISALSASMDLLSSRQLSFWEKMSAMGGGPGAAASAMLEKLRREQEQINREQTKQETIIRNVDKAFVKFKGNIDEFAKAISPDHPLRGAFLEEFKKRITAANEVQVETLETLKNKQKELIQQFESETSVNNTAELKQIGDKIIAYQDQIDKLEALKKAEKATASMDWDRQFSIFKPKAFNPTDGIKTITDTGSLSKVSNAGISALDGLNKALKINSNEFDLWLSGVNAALQQAAERITLDFAPLIHNALSGIGQALGGAISGSQKLGDALLGVLGGVLVQLGEMILAAGLATEAFKKSLQSLNGIAAIGAGVALIAMGSAIAGSIKGLGDSAGSSHRSAGGSGGGRSNMGNLGSNGLEIQLGGEFRVQGADLVYIFNRQNQLNGRTRRG